MTAQAEKLVGELRIILESEVEERTVNQGAQWEGRGSWSWQHARRSDLHQAVE